MPAQPKRHTIEDYLRIENDSQQKHEFRDGEIIAMPGGTGAHSRIIINFMGELRQALKGKPCDPYEGSLRIRIPRKPRFVYPDGQVVCGSLQYDPQDVSQQSIMNPRMVLEVLSPSTERYDRGDKFTDYREIETFQEYVLVSQKRASVEVFYRQGDGTWKITPVNGLDATVRLQSLGVELAMAEIYAGVAFPPEDAEGSPFDNQ